MPPPVLLQLALLARHCDAAICAGVGTFWTPPVVPAMLFGVNNA